MGFLTDIFGGGDPPDAPDYSPIAQASKEIADMMLTFYREQLDYQKESDAANRVILDQIMAVQIPAMQEQFQNYLYDRQRYEEKFQPIEDALIDEAMGYDTPERREFERSRAVSDVSQSFEAERQNAIRGLESYGVDPSVISSAALDRGMRAGEAIGQAQAATDADRRVEDVGRALKGEMVNIGRGYPGQVSQSAAQAVGAGNAAMGNQLNTGAQAQQMRSAALGGIGAANQAIGTWGNALNTGYQNQLSNWSANAYNTQAAWNTGSQLLGMALRDGGYVRKMADGGLPEEGPSAGEEPAEPTRREKFKEGLTNFKPMAIPRLGNNGGFGDRAAFANGGIPGEVEGPGDGTGVDDAIPAVLSDGEYVIPADVVRTKGTEFFDKLLEKYHVSAAQQRGIPVRG